MAVAFVQNASGTTQISNPAASYGAGPTQNNLLTAQLFTKCDTGATNPSGWSTAIDVVNAGPADTLRIAYKVAGAGESSTVTFTVVNDFSALGIFEFSGTATSTPLDKTSSTAIATGVTSLSSGTTATTSQADEVSVAAFGFRGVPGTPSLSNSFNMKNTPDSGGAPPADLVDGYRIETGTGTISTTASWTGAIDTMGAIATFKGVAAAADDGRPVNVPHRTGIGPMMRRALTQTYADTPVTPVELTQSAAKPFAAIGPRRRRSIPQQYADTPAIPVELTQSPAAPFRPGRGPGMGPMLLRRNLAWPPAISSPDVTLSLTGVQGTAAIGTFGVQVDIAMTGNAATGSIGTLTPSTSLALTGVSGTGSVGTLAPDTAVPMTGVVGTGSVGTLAPTNTITLTGNEATVSIGTLTPDVAGDVTIALSGVTASVLIGDLTPSGADVPTSPAAGGDDLPRRRKSPHKGFDLEAWKARQQDFEGTIRQAYDVLMHGPRAEEVRDIVAPHLETDPAAERDLDWQALFADYRAISDMIQLHELQMMEEEAIVSLLIH